jgi:hypothetical protein
MAGGAVTYPFAVWAKVPFSVKFEQPLLSAFAVGAMARANAVTAAIAKFFAMVLRCIINSFVFINCLFPGGDHSDRLFSFPPV